MKVSVFTNKDCMKCRMTETVMKMQHIDFDSKNLKDYPALIKKCKAKGMLSMPVVIVDNNGKKTMWNDFRPDKIHKLAKSK